MMTSIIRPAMLRSSTRHSRTTCGSCLAHWRRNPTICRLALVQSRLKPQSLMIGVGPRGPTRPVSPGRPDGSARLTAGPGPEVDLSAFLDRRDPENIAEEAEPFADRAGGWLDLMVAARDLHPISRACMGFHLWSLAGLNQPGDQMEAAVAAARIAASESKGAVFAPLAIGGAGGLRAGGRPAERLARWLDGLETACLTAMRHLDDVEAWSARAAAMMMPLSGRTPSALRHLLAEWPLVSAPMAEQLTGASRAAVQRNLALMEARGLLREVTGQGRFRMWRTALPHNKALASSPLPARK